MVAIFNPHQFDLFLYYMYLTCSKLKGLRGGYLCLGLEVLVPTSVACVGSSLMAEMIICRTCTCMSIHVQGKSFCNEHIR